MSCHAGPNAVESGLVLSLDAANLKSYPGSGDTWFDVSSRQNNAVCASTLSTATETPGTVIKLDNVNNIQVNFATAIDKYNFTFLWIGGL